MRRIRIVTAQTGKAIGLVRGEKPDAVLLDVRLPDLSGLDVLQELRQIDPKLPVISHDDPRHVRHGDRGDAAGTFDYVLKPWDLDELIDLVDKAIAAGRLSHVRGLIEPASDSDDGVDQVIGRSPAMQNVFKEIGRIAAQNVTVLILGESGTGKQLAARAIYDYSRRDQPAFFGD